MSYELSPDELRDAWINDCDAANNQDFDTDLTQDEINEIVNNSSGKLSDWQCRLILAWMMGYMRMTSDVDAARQAFFKQIKGSLP